MSVLSLHFTSTPLPSFLPSPPLVSVHLNFFCAILTPVFPPPHSLLLIQSLQEEVQKSVRSIKTSPQKSSSPKSPTQPEKKVRDRSSPSSSSSPALKNTTTVKKTEGKKSRRDIMTVKDSDDEDGEKRSSFRGSARDDTKSDTKSDMKSVVKGSDIIAGDRNVNSKSIRRESHVDLRSDSDVDLGSDSYDSDEPIMELMAKRKKHTHTPKVDNNSWESYSP